MRTTSLANSQSAKFTPQVRDQSREWEYVQYQLRQGQKLVRVFYGVMSVSPYGEGDRNERNLKAVYKAAGWELQDERYLQMAGLLAVMPLTMANGLARDFRSEEHTSELQSLMRISYAVFCLKKKNTENTKMSNRMN